MESPEYTYMINLTELLEESEEPPPPNKGVGEPSSIESYVTSENFEEEEEVLVITPKLFSQEDDEEDEPSNYLIELSQLDPYEENELGRDDNETRSIDDSPDINSGRGDINDYNVAYFADRDPCTSVDGFYVITDDDDDWNKITKNWFWLQAERACKQELSWYLNVIGKGHPAS